MKTEIVCALSIMFALLSPKSAPAQSGATTPTPAPQKLVIEVEVPAPVNEVWRAFSTSEGLTTWLTPEATVDLRPGGEWTARFPGSSTGGGTIIRFVAEKELVLAALAPDKFPHVRAERTRVVFQFEPRGNSTVVRLTQTGWKGEEEWIRAYEYLVAGNAELMAALHRRFVDGPIDWKKMLSDAGGKGNEGGPRR
jgi:uncharacterized protein YndB with AHSA1/START domain